MNKRQLRKRYKRILKLYDLYADNKIVLFYLFTEEIDPVDIYLKIKSKKIRCKGYLKQFMIKSDRQVEIQQAWISSNECNRETQEMIDFFNK